MIQLLTRFVARDETAGARLGDLLSRLEGSVPSEPGNIFYKVFSVADDPLTFFCWEGWETQEGVDGHLRHNEETGVNAQAADLLAIAPDTKAILALQPSSKE